MRCPNEFAIDITEEGGWDRVRDFMRLLTENEYDEIHTYFDGMCITFEWTDSKFGQYFAYTDDGEWSINL